MHRIICQNINAIGATLLISLIGPLLPFASDIEILAAQAKSHQELAVETETWQEFISESGGFSVLMPGKPTETIKPAKSQDNSGEERQFLLKTEDENLAYYISYKDFPSLRSQLNLTQIDEIFNVARDVAVEGGRLIAESKLTLNEYQGRQLEIESSNGVRIKARMYWVYPRFYLLMVGTSTKTFPADSDRFLNSFKLLKTTSLKSYPILQEAQTNPATKDEALKLYQEGSELYFKNRFEEAVVKLQMALEILRKNGAREEEAIVLSRLGRSYDNLGQYDKALEAFQQALVIFRQTGNRQNEGVTLDYIGRVYQNTSDLPKALNFQQQALEIFRQLGNRESSAIVLGNIGKIYHYQKQYDRALEVYQQNLAIFRSLGNRQGEGIMLDYIGSIYNTQGQYQKAMDFHEQALAVFTQIGNRRSQAIVMSNMGEVLTNLNQTQKALELLEQALAIFQKIGDKENASINIEQIQRLRQKR